MEDSRNATAGADDRPRPNEKLVKVFDSEQESEVMVVKGLLESAGIDLDMTSLSATQDTFPGVGGTIILVRQEDADAARRVILEGQRQSNADDEEEETDEIAVAEPTGEPPQKA
jgi:hypothetical protein